jgi:hypothetical protein
MQRAELWCNGDHSCGFSLSTTSGFLASLSNHGNGAISWSAAARRCSVRTYIGTAFDITELEWRNFCNLLYGASVPWDAVDKRLAIWICMMFGFYVSAFFTRRVSSRNDHVHADEVDLLTLIRAD